VEVAGSEKAAYASLRFGGSTRVFGREAGGLRPEGIKCGGGRVAWSSWQRCVVHFERGVLAPRGGRVNKRG